MKQDNMLQHCKRVEIMKKSNKSTRESKNWNNRKNGRLSGSKTQRGGKKILSKRKEITNSGKKRKPLDQSKSRNGLTRKESTLLKTRRRLLPPLRPLETQPEPPLMPIPRLMLQLTTQQRKLDLKLLRPPLRRLLTRRPRLSLPLRSLSERRPRGTPPQTLLSLNRRVKLRKPNRLSEVPSLRLKSLGNQLEFQQVSMRIPDSNSNMTLKWQMMHSRLINRSLEK